MPRLPDFLEGGDVARLIPVGSASQRERAACSVLLAALRSVQPFAHAFFANMDWRLGRWARVHGYSEPLFRTQPEGLVCRPDGLIVLDTGRREYRFIVETKIGGARIDPEQLASECRLARLNEVDAIITVSNELNYAPHHLPYRTPAEARNTLIYHWSWSSLVALAELLLLQDDDFDVEQHYILKEIVRYFDHDSTGIGCPNHMCAEWADLIERVQTRTPLSARDSLVLDAVKSWQQQLACLSIRQTRRVRSHVTLKLARSHQANQEAWLVDDVAGFVSSHALHAAFDYSTAYLPIRITADASRRNVTCHVALDAPLDRQRYGARVRWLLSQIPEDTTLPVTINLIWDRGQRSSAPLSALRNDLGAARLENGVSPRAFEVAVMADLGSRFSGPRTFMPAIENLLSEFYDQVASRVRPWQAPDREQTSVPGEPDEPGTYPIIAEKAVVQSGAIDGRAYSIFDDGSIEIETAAGRKSFSSFAELRAAETNGAHPTQAEHRA